MDIGSISRTYDGRVALRFERSFPYPPEKVWKVLTDPQHLRDWFPAVVEFELAPGATLEFRSTQEQTRRFSLPEGHTSTGSVLTVRVGRILEYLWDSDVLHWELTPDGSGGCWLTLTHTTDDEEDALAHGAAWQAGFEVVEAQLAGRPVDWSCWDRAAELSAHYRRDSG
ncbi:SRPBCC family protein [Rhodococcus sp. CH91]|uniref:SRPBCC family protein n=1 Tax=Rhodococcus sp. CH91 TaxID=2910256 RepID=UPI001F4BC7BD|nr:SRPBCC family protein [Rhodococcus sp. CH91]